MPVLQFSGKRRPESAEAIRSFESPTAEVINRQHPLAQRSVLYVLASMFVFIIAFISLVQLDRVVTALGRTVPISGTMTVQPLDKAIITSVLVATGDTVKKGQVLATLDPTFVKADQDQLQQKIASLAPETRRIEAEEAQRRFGFNPSQPYDLLQESIRKQRETEFHSGVLDFDQRIQSTAATIAGLERSIADFKERFKIATEQQQMYVEMEKEKLVSHLQLITVEDQTLELSRNLGQAEDSLTSTKHLLESLKQQRQVYIDKWHDDNLNNLVNVKNQLEAAGTDLTKARKLTELVDLVSPVDAIVLRIPTLSKGGVATDAQPLFSLMPLDAPIEADVEIESKDRGFVKVGDLARLKLDAYKFLEHGIAEGIVKTISEDSFTEERGQDSVTQSTNSNSRAPYFDARIKITSIQLHNVPSHTRLIPGMTLQADIVVGRRTILWYLLGGALRSGSEAMREP